jgi:hypothetical protein
MGIWAEIKHALNSTLGTSEFQPLDKLIRYEGKSLIPSSNVFKTVSAETLSVTITNGSTSSPSVNIGSIRSKIGGTVTVRANMDITYGQNTTTYGKVSVYVNNVLKTTVTLTKATDTLTTSGLPTALVSFQANDVISFKLSGSSSWEVTNSTTITCRNVSILADTVDNVIDIL